MTDTRFLYLPGGDAVSSTRDQKEEASYKYCKFEVWNSLRMLLTDSSKSPKALFQERAGRPGQWQVNSEQITTARSTTGSLVPRGKWESEMGMEKEHLQAEHGSSNPG